MTKLRVLLFTLTLISCASVLAPQLKAQQELTPDDRDRYVTEIRAYKHRFLVKELDLNKETQKSFFALYDQMEDELMKMQEETRELERKVAENDDATDTELEAAAAAVYSQKEREGKIEKEYYEKFKEILTPRQLLKLRAGERKFNQSLLRHHKNRREREKKD